MDKQKKYWFTGMIAAVILIALIFFGIRAANSDSTSHSMNSHSSHNEESGTDIVPETASSTKDSKTETASTERSDEEEKQAEALNHYLEDQDEIMAEMMEDMEIGLFGNASLDYLEGMIPHHESAIEMAESYLKYGGGNETLKQLAQEIKSAQTDEIEQMEKLIDEIEASKKTEKEQEKAYLKVYNQMMSDHQHMNHHSASAKNVDQAFAEGMSLHHQMAVDMSKAILDYTDHEEVKKLAQQIIDTQEKEIEQMKNAL